LCSSESEVAHVSLFAWYTTHVYGWPFEGRRNIDQMKLVTLCNAGSCCPVVKIKDTQVEIGEEGNLCVLTLEQWEVLREKILKGEA
jgi:hypothetical protein